MLTVMTHIMDVARYWIEQGADGWRLDVPNEIDDDDVVFQDLVVELQRLTVLVDQFDIGEIVSCFFFGAGSVCRRVTGKHGSRDEAKQCCIGSGPVDQVSNSCEHAAASNW